MKIIFKIILGVILMTAVILPAGDENPRPVVGAIRWDAWTGGSVTEQMERSLGPDKYHERMPWFAKVIGKDKIKIEGGSPEIMDNEIDFAADAGLDYWAFLVYPEEHVMSASLKLYIKSTKRDKIKFCMILHNSFGVKEDKWPTELNRAVTLMKEKGYQTVLGNRPLVYTFFGGNFPDKRFNEFREAAKKKGLDPYCVFMGWNPARDYNKMESKGFEAVSHYAQSSSAPRFKALADSVERRYWKSAAKNKIPYIPLVTTGWNKEPRKDNPVSWEKGHAYHKQKIFTAVAKPNEIAEHLKRGIDFVTSHPDICKANAIIMYAWNEHDEGGWLTPTFGKDGKPETSRLDAIRNILKQKTK